MAAASISSFAMTSWGGEDHLEGLVQGAVKASREAEEEYGLVQAHQRLVLFKKTSLTASSLHPASALTGPVCLLAPKPLADVSRSQRSSPAPIGVKQYSLT